MNRHSVKYRTETDSMGKIKIPENAYFGSHTQRSLNNFPISNLKSDLSFIFAIVQIKKAACNTNYYLKLLTRTQSGAIIYACNRILKGELNDHFPVDVFQAGAGTSLNMNVNEVIANLANEKLGRKKGDYELIDANDQVNLSQSTNDVIPTALRIAVLTIIPDLYTAVNRTANEFKNKGNEFESIIKSGRTHLMDALPVSLGEEFKANGIALGKDLIRIKKSATNLLTLGIGGTAVGTGVNSHIKYQKTVISNLKKLTGLKLYMPDSLQESMQNTADFLEVSSTLRILAQNLIRIGNDLRLLSSGPGSGFSELILTEVQPGSSIMPGKINPSIIEMTTMVAFQVIGFDTAILMASQAGQLELNVFLPLIAFDLTSQIKFLTNSLNIFTDKCLIGIKPNREMTDFWLNRSTGTAAVLNPYIGYLKTAELFKEAGKSKKTLQEIAVKSGILTENEAEKIFNPSNLIKPNLKAVKHDKIKKS